MPEEKSKVGWVLVAIGLIAVAITIWYLFFRNPCKEGEKYNAESGLCESICPSGYEYEEGICVPSSDGGDILPPERVNGGGNGGVDGVTPSPLGTPYMTRTYTDYPRDVYFNFEDEGFNSAYQLEVLTGMIVFRKEAWLFGPDRLEIFKLDRNNEWKYIWGEDFWGVHDDVYKQISISLGRATIKGFKFHLRYGYFKSVDMSTV